MIRLATEDARALVHYLEREWMPQAAREAIGRLREAVEAEEAAARVECYDKAGDMIAVVAGVRG